jgi:DNA invertase Pin-like site-specific DNA recombinase
VEVIDDDLGRSGSGITRPGFEKLLAAICEGRVGAVVSIEVSRLARNGGTGTPCSSSAGWSAR